MASQNVDVDIDVNIDDVDIDVEASVVNHGQTQPISGCVYIQSISKDIARMALNIRDEEKKAKIISDILSCRGSHPDKYDNLAEELPILIENYISNGERRDLPQDLEPRNSWQHMFFELCDYNEEHGD